MAWILGWAVPECWFAPLARGAFPNARHEFFPAAPDVVERLQRAESFAWTCGYSLGSHLLLAARARGVTLDRVALLAPIFAFSREENLGGRVARAQVRWLARALPRDPASAVADFYRRAALDIPDELAATAKREVLRWGLEELERSRVEPPLPAGWRAWCGDDDALLDAARLREIAPEVKIVARSTHHPRGLMHAMAEEIL